MQARQARKSAWQPVQPPSLPVPAVPVPAVAVRERVRKGTTGAQECERQGRLWQCMVACRGARGRQRGSRVHP